jgi:hypothetical protein
MLRLVRELIHLLISIVEVLLALRFVLKLLGARSASFVAWVYGATQAFVAPFSSAFPNYTFGGGFTLELTTLFAMLAFALIGLILAKVIDVIAGH